MKKKGFTLAEVLITLGLIGVVAAITLPTFTTNIQNQSNASKLSATVSTLENAFSAIIAGEGYDDLDEPRLYTNYISPNMLDRYVKGGNGGNAGGATRIYGSAQPFKTISGGAFNVNYDGRNFYELKSGAVIFAGGGETDESCNILLDVNGAAGPNRLGRDVFRFHVYNYGALIPYGSNHNWANADSVGEVCSIGNLGNGSGCTGRLIENNYKVDY